MASGAIRALRAGQLPRPAGSAAPKSETMRGTITGILSSSAGCNTRHAARIRTGAPMTEATAAPATRPPSLLYAVKQVELAIRAHLDDLLKPAGRSEERRVGKEK